MLASRDRSGGKRPGMECAVIVIRIVFSDERAKAVRVQPILVKKMSLLDDPRHHAILSIEALILV